MIGQNRTDRGHKCYSLDYGFTKVNSVKKKYLFLQISFRNEEIAYFGYKISLVTLFFTYDGLKTKRQTNYNKNSY